MPELPLHISEKKIAIIGGSFSGTLLALLLNTYGFRCVEILEQGPEHFPPGLASFMDAGTLIHHANFGGHSESFQRMISASIFFRRLFPEDCFSASRSMLLLPNGGDNPAIGTADTPGTAHHNLLELQGICRHMGSTPYGNADEIFHSLTEERMRAMYGDVPGDFKCWLGNDGVFDSGYDVAQFFANPDRLIDYLKAQISKRGIQIHTQTVVKEVATQDGGYNLIDDQGEIIREKIDMVIGAAHAGNFTIKWPGVSDRLPGIMRRKGLVLLDGRGLNVPATVMIRGFYGALLPVGKGFFLAVSGKEFDLDTLPPGATFTQIQEKLRQWSAQSISRYSHHNSADEYMDKCIADLALRFPFVKDMKRVGAKFGTHVYDESREGATPDVASKRLERAIGHGHIFHNQGVLVLGHTKLTTIPLNCVEILNRVVQILLGQSSAVLYDQHGQPVTSSGLFDEWIGSAPSETSGHFIPRD